MKNKSSIGLLIICCFLGIFLVYGGKESRIETISTVINISDVSGRVIIEGNAELDAFPNKTGNGTLGNPYVIQNLTIDGNFTDYCIFIRDTDKYLTIFRCFYVNSTSMV